MMDTDESTWWSRMKLTRHNMFVTAETDESTYWSRLKLTRYSRLIMKVTSGQHTGHDILTKWHRFGHGRYWRGQGVVTTDTVVEEDTHDLVVITDTDQDTTLMVMRRRPGTCWLWLTLTDDSEEMSKWIKCSLNQNLPWGWTTQPTFPYIPVPPSQTSPITSPRPRISRGHLSAW